MITFFASNVAQARRYAEALRQLPIEFTMKAAGSWKDNRGMIVQFHMRKPSIVTLSNKNDVVIALVDGSKEERLRPYDSVIVFEVER